MNAPAHRPRQLRTARAAQIFTIDFILGLLIITGALLALLVYSPSKPAPFRDDLERVSVLMTEGEPTNWNASTVAVPGFLSDGRFNETKIAQFNNLSLKDQRRLLGFVSSYSIAFSVNNTATTLCANCGEPVPADYDDLFVVRRLALLNSSVAIMQVTLWRS